MSDMDQSDLVAPEVSAEVAPAAEPVAPEVVAAPVVVPVLQQTPSSESETQQPEEAPVAVEPPLPLEDAVRVLLVYVKAHRTAGDADLEAAVADVEASLAAQA